MAMKTRRSKLNSKRCEYVSENSESSAFEMNYSSSDEGPFQITEKSKVRKGISIQELRKESENFEMDEDHIYTKVKPESGEKIIKGYLKSNICPSNKANRHHGQERRKSASNRKRSSDTAELADHLVKRQKCYSKNAVMARLNRERKKNYITSLERDNSNLQDEIKQFRKKMEYQTKVVGSLKREVTYLRSLLANSKEICQVLSNLKVSTGLPVSSSIDIQKEINSPDHDYISDNNVNGTAVQQDFHIPRTRSITNGPNFPIALKDVNLGTLPSAGEEDCLPPLIYDKDLVGSPFLPFETDEYWDKYSLNSCSLNDTFENDWDLQDSFDEIPISNFNEKDNEFINIKSNELLQKPSYSDVGVCIHVNKKKISVEFCSLCSKNFGRSFEDLSN